MVAYLEGDPGTEPLPLETREDFLKRCLHHYIWNSHVSLQSLKGDVLGDSFAPDKNFIDAIQELELSDSIYIISTLENITLRESGEVVNFALDALTKYGISKIDENMSSPKFETALGGFQYRQSLVEPTISSLFTIAADGNVDKDVRVRALSDAFEVKEHAESFGLVRDNRLVQEHFDKTLAEIVLR